MPIAQIFPAAGTITPGILGGYVGSRGYLVAEDVTVQEGRFWFVVQRLEVRASLTLHGRMVELG